MAERNPVYSGSILPFSRTAEGETYFDPDAGILGPLRDALMLPSRAARGEFGSEIGARNPELMEEAANFAATFTGTGLAIPKPKGALGMSGGSRIGGGGSTTDDLFEFAGEDGLLSEFDNIGNAVRGFVQSPSSGSYQGLTKAMQDDLYPEYKSNLDALLRGQFPSGKIPVSRTEPYADPTPGVERKTTYDTVDISDVRFAGSESERELIVDTGQGLRSFRMLDAYRDVPTRKDIAEIGTQMGEAREAGNEELFQSLKAQQAEMKARFDEANPKQPKAEAAPVPINQAARGRIGEKGFQNTADESDVVPDIFTYDKKVAASRASYGGEQGIPFVSKVRQQIETIDDDARMTGAQLLKSFRRNGVRDEALESSGIMYLLEKNKNNPVLTKDELVKAHERFAPKIELEDVPLDEDNLGGLDSSYGDMQRLFNSDRGTGDVFDYRNYEEVLFTNTNKETGKYLTKDAHHAGRGNIGHARLSTTDVGEYKNVSVVEEMQSDLQSLEMDNLLVKKGAAGFDKKVDSYINEKRKEFGEYLKDLDDAEQLAALSDKGSPTLSKNIPAIRQRINRALDGMDRAQATRDKLKRDYSGLDDRAYMMRVLSDLPLRNTYEDVDDYMMSDLVGDVYELGTKEAIEFAGKNLAQRRPVAELARSDADKTLNQVSDIVQAKPSSFVSPSTIQRMEDPSADFTPEAKSLIFTEGIFTNFGTQQIPEFKNEAFGILEALRKASPEAREQYLMRIEGDLNLRTSMGELETGLQPALPFKDTFDMSKYQADLLIERAFNKGQNGIAFPDHRDIAAQRGADEKSFVRGYKDAPDAALKEALERYPGAKIVEEKLSGTKHPAKILVFGEAKRVEDKPLFVNYAKGGMVYKGIGSMGREVL